MPSYRQVTALFIVFCGLCMVTIAEGGPNCPIPYHDVGGHCLFFNIMGGGSWQYMRDACHAIMGEMVKIDSADLFDEIVKYIESHGLVESGFWIGATDLDKEGAWQWIVDDSPVRMGAPFWGTYNSYGERLEPTGGTSYNCAAMDKRGHYYFRDYSCSTIFSVICEYPLQ